MTSLTVKLHELFTKLRTDEHVAHDDVDELVHQLTTHVTNVIIPAIEKHLDEIMPELAKNAVAHGLEAEREEARKIASRLEAAYTSMAKDHGPEVAQAVIQAATSVGVEAEPQPEAAEAPEHPAA